MENSKLSSDNNNGLNYQMCVLSAIAMLFVILGHNKNDQLSLGTFYGWFPYYSFHLPLFLFISGYFFRDLPEDKGFFVSFGKFAWKKIRSLIIPFYIVHGIFLLTNTFLRTQGFTYGTPFSLKEWLINPWTKYYSITYSVPTWYLIGIFLAEIYFILLRKLIRKLIRSELAAEITLLVLTLALGVFCVYIKNTGHPSEAAGVYMRSVVMLFFMELGAVYKKYLEKLDHAQSLLYFLLVLLAQFLIIVCLGNNHLDPWLYELSRFDTFGCNY
ncbi:MAG: acyltransferase family protein, partial [Parasporobacterium sp.]|nr:acyltransferase family protein [Parasporobacterium sp.]